MGEWRQKKGSKIAHYFNKKGVSRCGRVHDEEHTFPKPQKGTPLCSNCEGMLRAFGEKE
jgi:hypothetical protein